MRSSSPNITDLQASELVAKLGLSRSYAFELIKRQKTPSLDVAVRIEQEFGVPASAWVRPEVVDLSAACHSAAAAVYGGAQADHAPKPAEGSGARQPESAAVIPVAGEVAR